MGNIIIELDKIFTFEIDLFSNVLNEDQLKEILSDGRVASHFLERYIEIWFPELIRVDQKLFDHILTEDVTIFNKLSDKQLYNGIKLDQKCFTKAKGLQFCPSSMIGKNRVYNEELSHKNANEVIFICCDITNIPDIQIIFKDGKDLLTLKYKKEHIPFKDKEILFKDGPTNLKKGRTHKTDIFPLFQRKC